MNTDPRERKLIAMLADACLVMDMYRQENARLQLDVEGLSKQMDLIDQINRHGFKSIVREPENEATQDAIEKAEEGKGI